MEWVGFWVKADGIGNCGRKRGCGRWGVSWGCVWGVWVAGRWKCGENRGFLGFLGEGGVDYGVSEDLWLPPRHAARVGREWWKGWRVRIRGGYEINRVFRGG